MYDNILFKTKMLNKTTITLSFRNSQHNV